MNKCIYLLMAGFLMFTLSLTCYRASEASQQVMHVSERVKITRPEKPEVVQEEEKPAPKKTSPAELQVVATGQNAAQPKEVAATPVSLPVSKPAPAKSAPEEKPAELFVPDDPAPGEQSDVSDVMDEKQALFGDQEKYYVKKGRIDPFQPFLHKPEPKTADIRTQEIQRRAPRTPLERVALGQLKLTAVMRLTNDKMEMAMVEDNNGKGYIVKTGTYIGENGGRVSDITENKVIVEEKYNDVFGKISVRQIELKLQKQPGE